MPLQPQLPTDFALTVGPRMDRCDHPLARGATWSGTPCHILTATWQGIDDDRAEYHLFPAWVPLTADVATLPIGPTNYPRIGTLYSVTFAARPAQDLCVGLMMSWQGRASGPVEACVGVPAGDGEVVPTTAPHPPMTTVAETTTTTIQLSGAPLPSPLPAPTGFTLAVGELQEPCTHPFAGGWTSPCRVITATWQSLDDDRILNNLTPWKTFDPAAATLPIGPDRYPRTGTAYSVTIAARPGQELCVGLSASNVFSGGWTDRVEACVTVP